MVWSKLNCIASITSDGRGVNLRCLVRDPEDGKWVLSEPTSLKLPPNHEELQFVHLSWSSMGSDLVIVDAAGRILIYTNGYALGKMQLARPSMMDQHDELGAVVGLHWLLVFPVQQRVRSTLSVMS